MPTSKTSVLLVVLSLLHVPFVRGAGTFADGPDASGAGSRLPQISIEGNRFVDPDGNTVIFRGVAMIDPSALAGRGEWGPEYFDAAKSWNANIVRIPVEPAKFRATGEAEYLKLLDQGIQWAGDRGMYVIIDWHSIGNPLTDVYHRSAYITDRGETFRFWYTIASRYAGNTTVALYELFNEPTNRDGRMGRLPWSEYKAYIEELIYLIRKCDDTALPLVAGFNFAYDLTPMRDDPIDAERVAYSVHPYPQKRWQPWEPQWEKDWGFAAERFPLVATEFGFMSADDRGAHQPCIADEDYGHRIIAFFEERGISWMPWVFDYDWVPALYSDTAFTPTRQGVLFREKLTELNK